MAEFAKLWTLAEANAMLPRVRTMLAKARQELSAMRDAEAQLRDLRTVWGDQILSVACPDHQEFLHHAGQYQERRDRYLAAAEAFAREGIQLKDPDTGLVDFPAQFGTRTVLLCWRDGEDAVRFYHDLESGFAGRKPVPALG